jgi:hypothetical protein
VAQAATSRHRPPAATAANLLVLTARRPERFHMSHRTGLQSVSRILLALPALACAAFAANPYLSLPDEKPVTREFTGKQWDNEKEDSPGDTPLTAQVTTVRLEKMEWGEIYRITFKTNPAAAAEQIGSYYLLVTDNEILRLDSEDMDREIRVIRAMKKQPKFEKADVLALSKGKIRYSEGPWTTEVKISGATCSHTAWHDGAGHFSTCVWKKGAGLVEIAAGRGADLSGYRLKAKP